MTTLTSFPELSITEREQREQYRFNGLMETACLLLGRLDDFVEKPYLGLISVKNVLFKPWNNRILERSVSKMQETPQTMPPVFTVAYTLGKRKWYVLSDGNHRATACYVLDYPMIKADNSGYTPIYPQNFRLFSKGSRLELWRIVGYGAYLFVREVTPEVYLLMVDQFKIAPLTVM